MKYVPKELFAGERYQYTRGWNLRGIVAWACGCAAYFIAAHYHWATGASIPGMLIGGLAYLSLMWKNRSAS
jgi:cytosine/uracil/thiamine/allantoin permease